LPTTSYALLGLLALGPMSGYDLEGFVSRSIANFWPIEKSQVYRELARLEALGFLEATEVAQQGAPNKRVYALTDQGGQALDDWLAESAYQRERVRNAFLVKLFFGWRMPPDRLEALVEQYRLDALAERDRLQAIVDRLTDVPAAAFGRATARFGLAHAEATLEWCDQTRAALDELYGRAARAGRTQPRPGELVVTSPE
jgi:PadR family transcriptional regulator, regulatory protein AphA